MTRKSDRFRPYDLEGFMKVRNIRRIRDLADLAGLKYNCVRDINQGVVKSPEYLTLRALARVLGVSTDDLYTPPPGAVEVARAPRLVQRRKKVVKQGADQS